MKKKLRSKNKFIPVNVPRIFKDEKSNVKDCLDTGWISSEGSYVKKFESKFGKYNKRRYAIAVSSGTAALEIAIKSLNLKKGDEIIIPTFSIISTALCVIKFGLKPVLVDSNLSTWNMDVDEVIKKITTRTKAIIVTHIYGFPVDMSKILKIARKKKIRIVEDAAEMIGQTYYNKKCGSFGDISTFSFYANKQITTGEGGMIVTNSKKMAEKCSELRNLCFKKNRRFVHYKIGWNYRMSNIQAALGVAQLERKNEIVKLKRRIGSFYNKKLKKIKKISLPIRKVNYADNIYWVYTIILKKNIKLQLIMCVKSYYKRVFKQEGYFIH